MLHSIKWFEIKNVRVILHGVKFWNGNCTSKIQAHWSRWKGTTLLYRRKSFTLGAGVIHQKQRRLILSKRFPGNSNSNLKFCLVLCNVIWNSYAKMKKIYFSFIIIFLLIIIIRWIFLWCFTMLLKSRMQKMKKIYHEIQIYANLWDA